MKSLLLYLIALPAFAQTQTTLSPVGVASTGVPLWLTILLIGGACVVVWVILKRKKPELAASIEAGADKLKDSLTDLLHKQAETHAAVVQTNAELATVVASPPVQAVVNAPAPAPTPTANPAPSVIRTGLLPGGTPVDQLPLYKGNPRLTDWVYPDEDDYRRGGNEPPWGWVEVLRTVNGVPPRRGAAPPQGGDATYHRQVATPEQMALIRITYDSALSSKMHEDAYAGLYASLGFPGATGETGTPANTALARLLQDNPLNG